MATAFSWFPEIFSNQISRPKGLISLPHSLCRPAGTHPPASSSANLKRDHMFPQSKLIMARIQSFLEPDVHFIP